jgi:C1A family cysteine protease
MESAVAIAKNAAPVGLSEQQLIDCSTSYGNQGCDGGLMDYAFEYVIKKGSATESSYPYSATGPNSCKKFTATAHIGGYCDVTVNNPTALVNAIAIGPVSVAVEADQACFQFYTSGVMDSSSCGTNLDHGVLAVGYGTDSKTKKDFYKVKNSWGASWGDNGYILIGRSKSSGPGICGIQMAASYPTDASV